MIGALYNWVQSKCFDEDDTAKQAFYCLEVSQIKHEKDNCQAYFVSCNVKPTVFLLPWSDSYLLQGM